MTVNDLIKYLQELAPIAGDNLVMARDDNGKLSTYPVLQNFEDRFIIDAWPEPDTQYYKNPFECLADERCCPVKKMNTAFIRWRYIRDEKPVYWKPCLVRYESSDGMEICVYHYDRLLQRNEWLSYAGGDESSFSENNFDRWAYTSDVNEILEKGIDL